MGRFAHNHIHHYSIITINQSIVPSLLDRFHFNTVGVCMCVCFLFELGTSRIRLDLFYQHKRIIIHRILYSNSFIVPRMFSTDYRLCQKVYRSKLKNVSSDCVFVLFFLKPCLTNNLCSLPIMQQLTFI
jgi:hypothetical protein